MSYIWYLKYSSIYYLDLAPSPAHPRIFLHVAGFLLLLLLLMMLLLFLCLFFFNWACTALWALCRWLIEGMGALEMYLWVWSYLVISLSFSMMVKLYGLSIVSPAHKYTGKKKINEVVRTNVVLQVTKEPSEQQQQPTTRKKKTGGKIKKQCYNQW